MRRRHFDALQPICPRCALNSQATSTLELAAVLVGEGDLVKEGLLHCPNGDCRLEYPIIDGVPIIVPDVRSYLVNNSQQIQRRDDLSVEIESLLADALGPGSELDLTRQHMSIYCWSHYGDLDSAESQAPGSFSPAQCLAQGWSLSIEPSSPSLDLGCSVGRTTFELAQHTGGLALGIDLNFAMLKAAQNVLNTGSLRYGRRRTGLVSDRREFDVDLPGAELVDFWACDSLALPFTAGQFRTVVALNLLDCVASPCDLLAAIRRMLEQGGVALISTPYDWSPNATPVEAWVGGHSQRGPNKGAGEPLLRALLTPGAHPQSIAGLELVGEIEGVPWKTRLHDRSTVTYTTHLVAIRAT